MIRKAKAKWPGLTKYLNATELGIRARSALAQSLQVRPSAMKGTLLDG